MYSIPLYDFTQFISPLRLDGYLDCFPLCCCESCCWEHSGPVFWCTYAHVSVGVQLLGQRICLCPLSGDTARASSLYDGSTDPCVLVFTLVTDQMFVSCPNPYAPRLGLPSDAVFADRASVEVMKVN